MAKDNFKTKLADKGEKYAFLVAGGIMLLLAVVGVMELSGSPDPNEFIKGVDDTTNRVKSTINSPVDAKAITQLPKDATTVPKIELSKTAWDYKLFFDPIAPPDTRRINPIVLAPTEIQADFLWAKILAYDIVEGANGGLEIAVLRHKPTKGDKLDKDNTIRLVGEIGTRFAPNMRGPRQPARVEGPKGGAAPMVVAPQPIGGAQRMGVQYVPLDPEKLQDQRFALTIMPERLVVVQAAFPLRAQLEEIQKALRLQSISEVLEVYKDINKDEEIPRFRGMVVERQVLYPDGTVETPWQSFDFENQYRNTIFRRKFRDKDDEAQLNYVLLHPGHELVMPLPMLLTGKYPELRIPALIESIKKLVAANKPPAPPKGPNQFTGGGSVFGADKGNAAGAIGQPNVGGEGINIPKLNKDMKDDGMGTATNQILEMDHIMLRFVDNDVVADRLYQYRIKVRMQNPNWVGEKDKKNVAPWKDKADKVSRPSDADVEMMEGPWFEMKGTVSIPREEFLFSGDPQLPDPKNTAATINLRPGQGVLQIQRWLAEASVDSHKEPVADWIVADVVATRGSYFGGKQFVNLPLWNSEFNRYILREAASEKGKSRRGVVMDPTRPGPLYVVAEVEGGAREFRPMTKSILMREDTATEILLIDEQGRLQVRSPLADRTDPNRARREEMWKDWIKKADSDTTEFVPNLVDPKKKDFN